MSADIRHLLRRARAHGLTVRLRGSGHYEVRRGDRAVTVPATPSGHYWIKAAIGDIRRHLGVDLRTQTRPKRRRNRKDNPT